MALPDNTYDIYAETLTGLGSFDALLHPKESMEFNEGLKAHTVPFKGVAELLSKTCADPMLLELGSRWIIGLRRQGGPQSDPTPGGDIKGHPVTPQLQDCVLTAQPQIGIGRKHRFE